MLKLVDWHLLLFFAALFIVVDGLSDTGLPDAIYSRLQPIFGSSALAQAWNLTWFPVVRIERFLKRAVRVGGRKLDRAIRGTGFDVEGARAFDDVWWQSHYRGFGREHDRG